MLMKTIIFFLFIALSQCLYAQRNMQFTINTQSIRKPISPYIFGANEYKADSKNRINSSQNRFGGNRTTAYNWETNFSNAGADYINNNDNWLYGEVEINQSTWSSTSGAIVQAMNDTILKGGGVPMVTLQAAGYVAADANGQVTCTAPCNRWIPVYANKPGKNYIYPPDLTDNAVYMDEQVSWLINRYGTANQGGVKFYQIDNEPDIWFTTHALIRPTLPTPTQLGAITEEYAKMIRTMDPSAEIFGFVGTGAWGIENWIKGAEFLADMKARSDKAGMRLMDVFDIHYYQGEMYNVTTNKAWNYLQGSRILWDSTFYFAGAWGLPGNYKEAAKLLRRYKSYISSNYPNTKLAITEWNTQIPTSSVYDGLVGVDILGVFINEDIYAANHFNNTSGYTQSAFKLYRNYDENKSTIGNMRVYAKASDYINASIYASVDSTTSDKELHLILINKDTLQAIQGTFTINSLKNYSHAKVFYFDNTSQQIKSGTDISSISNNTFNYTLPVYAAAHLILYSDDACLMPVLGPEQNLCNSTEITLNTNIDDTRYSFVWKKNNAIIPNANAAQLSISQKGKYSVVASASGCADKLSEIDISSDLLDAPDVTICKGETASLKVNGTYAYQWSTDKNMTTVVSTANPYLTAPTTASDYYVTQTNAYTYVMGPTATGSGETWSIGPADLSGDDKAYTISVVQPLTFTSVGVNPANNNTNVVIRVYNTIGFNKSVTINGVSKGLQQVNVNMELPVGDYVVDLVGSSNSMNLEATEGAYPYTQNKVITVNAIKPWAETRKGFFYNWTFSKPYTCAPAKVHVDVETCSGLQTDELTTSHTITPNPSTSAFTLSVNRQTQVEVFSLLGKKLLETTVNSTYTFGDELPAGIYLIRLSAGGSVKTTKLVKN